MKINDRVVTVDGKGLIVDIEFYSRIEGGINRYGVKLDIQKYSYPVSYYFPNHIEKEEKP